MVANAQDTCPFTDRSTCLLKEALDRARTSSGLPIEIDVGTTRTDFADPLHPKQRFIGPNGIFNDSASDGVETPEEYRQAAIRLAEIAQMGIALDRSPIAAKDVHSAWAADFLRSLGEAGMDIDWLFTDPIIHGGDESQGALDAMRDCIKAADLIWAGTRSIRNEPLRKQLFAKDLYRAMTLPKGQGGMGITFFDPMKDLKHETGHPLFSANLDCIGSWLYGMLCERYGIKATPVQRFTNEEGESINHVLVGISLDMKDPQRLTLVSFHPGEAGFDISLQGTMRMKGSAAQGLSKKEAMAAIAAKQENRTSFAPISRLDLLATISLNRAFGPGCDAAQRDRLIDQAVGMAPHNFHIRYRLGLFYERQELPEKAVESFQKALELNPDHSPSREHLERLHRKSGNASPIALP